MKQEELIRMILFARIIIPIVVILAIIKESISLWEAGILYFVGSVSVFVIGICVIIVALAVTKEKN